MWFCFNDGFFSVVEDYHNPTNLLVRARRLVDMKKVFPKRKITVSTDRDYMYRISIPREEWAKIVSERIMDINYNNFKNSVVNNELHAMYEKFWLEGWYLQFDDRDSFTFRKSAEKKAKRTKKSKKNGPDPYAYEFKRLTQADQDEILRITEEELEKNRYELYWQNKSNDLRHTKTSDRRKHDILSVMLEAKEKAA